jgi:NDP-sugar pyrophosphorylase family protein
MILHQIEALAAAGVTDIVLAVNYRPEVMEKHLAEVSHTRQWFPRSAGTDPSATTVFGKIQH